MKPTIAKCHVCGVIEISEPYTDGDGAVIVPVQSAPTLSAYAKIYKEQVGETILKTTGEKPSKVIEKQFLRLTHLDIEDTSEKAQDLHTLGKIECWTDNP